MLTKIIKFFLWPLRPFFEPYTNKQSSKSNGHNPTVPSFEFSAIIWSPVYDEETECMSKWLEEIHIPSGVQTYAFGGSTVNLDELVSSLQKNIGGRGVHIFCGHGTSSALLGPPQGNDKDIEIDERRYSVLYKIEDIETASWALFAFCCEAGRKFGKAYGSVANRVFLGYKRKIPLNLVNSSCSDSWKSVVQTISEEILRDGTILNKHETLLKSLYHEEFLRFHEGEEKKNDQAFLMMMYLVEHQRSLCRYGG